MLEICSIASGSNGNCYYIGNETDAVLVDAGINRKQILTRLAERGLDFKKIMGVFISHEHSDHLRGAYVMGRRLNIPIYMTAKTYFSAYNNLRPENPKIFAPEDEIKLDGFTIFPFLKNHDAAEPCSFRVQYKNKNVGVFTDIGEPCQNVTSHLQKCDALFLESNYDEKMLWTGVYPYFLKKRVASAYGHLSNKQAFDLLESYANENLQYVLLSHISKENNTADKAMETFLPFSDRFNVILTSRFEAGEVYRID